jgi:heme/copper-type cytochrome/quinol oxidase subunit 1
VAEGVHRPEQEPAPPPGEAIHLPGPSYLPVLTGFGIALALVGLVISFVITAIGGVIAIVSIVRWIRETRHEMAELPLEHG